MLPWSAADPAGLGDELTTTSIKVAAVRSRRPTELLRLIRKRMAESGEWGVRNFAETVPGPSLGSAPMATWADHPRAGVAPAAGPA